MWIISAGRQTESVTKVAKEYYEDQTILEIDMIENLLQIVQRKGKNSLSELTCIGIMDAGIYSLKDWRPLFQITKQFKDIPFIIYSRYPNMTPKSSIFGENVKLVLSEDEISVTDFVRRMKLHEQQADK